MLGARRRGPLGLVALLFVGIACLLASTPSWAGQPASPVNPTPGSSPNPTSTNVPYLAWKGENIRVVKCSDDLTDREMAALRSAFRDPNAPAIGLTGLSLSIVVEDWSGAGSGPRLLDGTREFFLGNRALCARGTFTSTQAGLARIKMAVGVGTWNIDLTGDERAALVTKLALLQHQFLAGWMNMSDPQLTELPLGGDGPNSDGNPLGSGMLNTFFADNVYRADSRNQGVLQAKVTGSMPVDGMGTITLPDAWPAFAAKFATDANPNNENPSNRWDIHDQSDIGSFATEGHPFAGANCTTPARPVNVTVAGPILDAVDNCAGGQAFSRVFDADGPGAIAPVWLGLTAEDTVGPFDPQRDETFLPDGQLTADDAPMPAARVDFTIAQNKDLLKPIADQKDTGGVGSLRKTDKHTLYSADRAPNANAGSGNDDPHNLYAPFYSAYIPATGAPEAEASGTDGLPGNDFTGYLVGDRQGGEGDTADRDFRYDYWDIAHEFTGRTLNAVETQCLRRNDEARLERLTAMRQTPEGAQKVAIYTDEHGVGDVNFEPGSGFWFNALMNTQPDLDNNANGGCDLKYLKDNVLGTADITADARYPNQPVNGGDPAGSATIHKTVKSLFAKYLAVYPKGSTPDLRNARIVVAHAQDIDGSPFAREVVCFVNTTKGNDGVTPFIPTDQNRKQKVIGPYDVSGTSTVDDPDNRRNSQRICLRTNDDGNAAVEVQESQGNEINIIGDFTAEGILRDVKIPFGSPSLDPIDPGAPTRTPGTTPIVPQPETPGNTTPSQQAVRALAAGNVQVSSSRVRRSAPRTSVRFARVVNSAKGTRYLSVRLKGTKRTATVRIQLMGYNGKVVRTVTRTVAVGRTVSLRNVRLGANIRSARVAVVNR
jgi:hypothetical protein